MPHGVEPERLVHSRQIILLRPNRQAPTSNATQIAPPHLSIPASLKRRLRFAMYMCWECRKISERKYLGSTYFARFKGMNHKK